MKAIPGITSTMLTIVDKMSWGDIIEVFKIYKGWSGLKFDELFVINGNNLRGHKVKLFKKRFSLNVGKYCFSNRVVEIWNDLPDNILTCKTLDNFKNKLDIFLRHDRGFL